MIKTYGDKYFSLTEGFIKIQDEFIAAILYGDRAKLSRLTLELRKVQGELKELRSYMKANKLTFSDDYPKKRRDN